MFEWTEIALIGVVALVAIGPKDLPVAIKAVAAMIKKARRMAGEFQTHVDEMVKDADLGEVRDQFSKLRNLDIKGTLERAVDSDGSIRRTMNENPLADLSASTPAHDVASPVLPPEPVAVAPIAVDAPDGLPAFIPPAIARPPVPPAFIPPSASRTA